MSRIRTVAAVALAAGVLPGAAHADPIGQGWADFPPLLTSEQKLLVIDTLWATPTTSNAAMGVRDARATIDGIKGQNARAVLIGDGPLTDSSHAEFADLVAGGKLTTLPGGSDPTSGHGQSTASLIAGTTVGGAPEVQQLIVAPWAAAGNPIARSIPLTEPGDVMVLEYTASVAPYHAAEYATDSAEQFKLFRAASDLGRIVVEPSGNGIANHDQTGTPQRDAAGDVRDSGAILVGAGESPVAGVCSEGQTARSRIGYSGYGSRIDVQGNACSPGAATDADLVPEDKLSSEAGTRDRWLAARNGTVEHNKYASVSGTSGAVAVLGGIVAGLSSAYQESEPTKAAPTPEAVRAALVATGSAQQQRTGLSATAPLQKIGPVPNLGAAYRYLVGGPNTDVPTGPATTTNPRPTFTFSSPTAGAAFECRVVPDPLPSFETLKENPLDPFAACSSTWESKKTLNAGSYRVQARATKASTTVLGYDASPASLPFTVQAATGTATVTSSVLKLRATTGARNVTVDVIGSSYRVKDTQGLTAATGCTQVSSTEVDCPTAGIASIDAIGSAADDRFVVSSTVTVPVRIDGDAGQDILASGSGNDTLLGGSGDDTIAGGDGGDRVEPGTGENSVYGNSGGDTFAVVTGAQDFLNDSATDADTDLLDLSGLSKAATVERSTSGYAITSTGYTLRLTGIDSIIGTRFADRITVDDSGVSVTAGEGDDVLTGGAGNDGLVGGAGADTLFGAGGNDVLGGNEGNDTYRVSPGNDTVYDSDGDDTYDLSSLSAGATMARVTGTQMSVTAAGLTAAISNIDVIRATAYGDTIAVDDSGVTVYGGAGNDTITGGTGVDKLYGEAGNDLLTGGLGADWLYGGDGVDTLRNKDGVTDAKIDCGAGSNELSQRDFWLDSDTGCERWQFA